MAPDNGVAGLLALELMEADMPEAEPLVQGYLKHSPSATIRMAYARVLMGWRTQCPGTGAAGDHYQRKSRVC